MADKQIPKLLISQWSGRASNRSPHLTPAGALTAENVSLVCPGELRVRSGYRPVTMANAISPVTDEVIAAWRYSCGLGEFVLYETSAGAVKCGRDPS
jgi:hypothetical protein